MIGRQARGINVKTFLTGRTVDYQFSRGMFWIVDDLLSEWNRVI